MRTADRAAQVLRAAEDRLRAEGLTGALAFERLLTAMRARLGDEVVADPIAAAALAELPVGADVDLLGLAYERFFADLFKGRHGQYFTPRPLIDLLLARAGVGPEHEVLDPTCGSGGFLVCAARRGARVRGIERDPMLAALAAVNLRLAGHRGEVVQADFFRASPTPVDVVVANPPFSVEVTDPLVLERFELGRGRSRVLSDWLFIEAVERWVRPGGLAAVVLPWSLLVNPRAAVLRDRLRQNWRVEAVCALPEGVFRPFGGAAGRACLLWLHRRPCAEGPTWWGEVDDPGYDVRSERLRTTDATQIPRLSRGEGWAELREGRWTPAPPGSTSPTRSLHRLAALRSTRTAPRRPATRTVGLIELADADKRTGEVVTVRRMPAEALAGHKAEIAPGDLLVSRMRPELGNVAVAPTPEDRVALVGSTEWIVLTAPATPHYVLHALRTPAWRAQVTVTGGQTRPRTSADQVLASQVPWPGEALAERVDGLSRRLHAGRAALVARLHALQQAVDDFAAGALDEDAFDEAIAAVERANEEDPLGASQPNTR